MSNTILAEFPHNTAVGASTDFAGGQGVLALAEGTAPTSNPTGGGVVYTADAGSSVELFYRGTSGGNVQLTDQGTVPLKKMIAFAGRFNAVGGSSPRFADFGEAVAVADVATLSMPFDCTIVAYALSFGDNADITITTSLTFTLGIIASNVATSDGNYTPEAGTDIVFTSADNGHVSKYLTGLNIAVSAGEGIAAKVVRVDSVSPSPDYYITIWVVGDFS